jgi:sigma-54 dependent transcriptional regulator, acetoin dehydrogenase operon transcriptional activator AcoR
MVLAESNEISEKDLPEFMFANHLLLTAPHGTPADECLKSITPETVITLSDMERKYIGQVLSVHDSNYSETARKLGISRSTLWRKIREYGLDKKEKGEGNRGNSK